MVGRASCPNPSSLEYSTHHPLHLTSGKTESFLHKVLEMEVAQTSGTHQQTRHGLDSYLIDRRRRGIDEERYIDHQTAEFISAQGGPPLCQQADRSNR